MIANIIKRFHDFCTFRPYNLDLRSYGQLLSLFFHISMIFSSNGTIDVCELLCLWVICQWIFVSMNTLSMSYLSMDCCVYEYAVYELSRLWVIYLWFIVSISCIKSTPNTHSTYNTFYKIDTVITDIMIY